MAANTAKIHNLGFGFLGHHPVEELTELVRTAEELGFTSAWIAEDYFYAGAFSLASAVARSTEKIQLGIGVINPYTRHPVLSAMESAALDTVSKGRAIIGIGAANKLWIEIRMGMPYSKPITATRECVEIIKGLVGQGKLTYHGSVFQVEGVELEFQPYRRDLPVYMGVKGDKALFQAGQAADGVLISAGCTLEYIPYARDLIAQGARSVGRNPDELRLAAYLPTCIRPTHQEAVDAMRPFVRRYLGLHGDKPILTCAGFDPAVLRPFREAFLAGETCPNEVTDEMVEKIVVAGTADECRARILDYMAAGVEMPVCFEVGGDENPLEQLKSIHAHLLAD